MENENDEVIVDNEEETNEEEGVAEETPAKADKPKRTPQEEYEYHKGRTERLAKKLGLKDEKVESVKNTPTDKPSELDYGQMALLRQEGVKGAGETTLFKEVMVETGKDVLATLDSNYFKTRLAEFRETQESKDAIPKGTKRSGQIGTTDFDIAYAKFKDTGELPQDFKTRVAIKNKVVAEEADKNMFSGPSVIGPQVQQY